MPIASIVVPSFNASATLPATLQALQAQSHDDFEIIVVDDGSQDTTATIALDAARHDPRIHVVRQANRGLAGARNSGIAAAKGKYIGFCDADDIWQADKLAAHVRHLEANPKVGISFSGASLIDNQGAPLGLFQAPRLTGITPRHVFHRNPIGNGSAPVMRRAAAEAISWTPKHEQERAWVFDETFTQSEDIECWLRLILTTTWGIEGIEGALVQYRVNGAGLSAATDRQLASWERMVAKLTPLAPDFFAQETPAARAYQYRYLARRAISAHDGKRAQTLINASLKASLRPLWSEPAKTLSTLAAAVVLRLVGRGPIRFAAQMLRRRAQTT